MQGLKANIDSVSNSNSRKKNSNVFIPVRVIDIVLNKSHPKFKEVGEWNGIGTIFYDFFENPTTSNSSGLKAKPFFSNYKIFPLKNEIVFIIASPNYNSQTLTNSIDYYYITPINLWNSSHHNALPNPITFQLENSKSYNDIESGNIKNTSKGNPNVNLGDTFKENSKIRPLLPFEGDVIHEGRWGHSVRFGSTIEGDPIMIIRNKTYNVKEDLDFILEDINKDGSSIYCSSNFEVPLEPSSENYKSYIKNLPQKINKYKDNQIIITSDRLVFNSRKDHILFSSNKSINLNSAESVNVDTKEHIIKASSIKLGGHEAEEPLLLGNKSVNLLNNVLSELINLTTQLSSLTSLPSGVPFIPLNAQAIESKIRLTLYKNQLNSLLSSQNKTL